MNLKQSWLIIQMRPRVIHRLPGRIRVHIPALKKVDDRFQEIVSVLLKGFTLPEHFNQVKITYATGSILVTYKHDKISERQIMNWVFDVKNIAESILMKFIDTDNEKISNKSIKLISYLEKASREGQIIDKKFRIPDEIWS